VGKEQGAARRFDLISFSFADNPRSRRFVTASTELYARSRAEGGGGRRRRRGRRVGRNRGERVEGEG